MLGFCLWFEHRQFQLQIHVTSLWKTIMQETAEIRCRLWYHCGSVGLDSWGRRGGTGGVGFPVGVDQESSSAIHNVVEQSKYLKQKND